MSSIPEERKLVMQGGPSASLLSSRASSSFCSFDVKIWEELHLQSLSSASSSINGDDSEKGQLCKAEKATEPSKASISAQGFSFFSSTSTRTSFSGMSSPRRLSNASSTSGCPLLFSRKDTTLLSPLSNSPLYHKAEQGAPPVVKVIQTGSMSFTNEELVLQQATISLEEPPFPTKRPHVAAESLDPPLEEEISTIADNSNASDAPTSTEKSIILGSFPHVKYSQVSAPDVYTRPISPLKPKGSIPFKWEETPGRPKAHAGSPRTIPSVPTLQLPPKLLQSSFSSSNCNTPAHSRSNSKYAAFPSVSPADGLTSKPTSVKSLWSSLVQTGRRSYREGGGGRARLMMLAGDEDPWSPTSTLIGPDASLSSTSSTSSTTLDTLCTSPGHSPEVQSAAIQACRMDEKRLCSQSSALNVACSSSSSSSTCCDWPSYIGNDLPNLAPSMERREELPLGIKATNRLRGFWASCRRWRSASSHRKRNHEEAEMWEPTLATYFHSMELERTSSSSGQPFLSHQRSLEKQKNQSNWVTPIQTAASSMDKCMGSLNESKSLLPSNLMREDVMIFSANPKHEIQKLREDVMIFAANPRHGIQKLTLGLKGKHAKMRRKAGGWVLRKLKKSSRVLAAVLRAVAKRSSKVGPTKKCKRRRLPYQHIDW